MKDNQAFLRKKTRSYKEKNVKDNKQEQLFTELTPEEGAAVAGGALLSIDRIQAINTGADFGFWEKDDTYITINGEKLGGVYESSGGDTHKVGITKAFHNQATVRLFDEDSGLFDNNDDPLGGFLVSSHPTNGLRRAVVSGSGSTYEVYYRVS